MSRYVDADNLKKHMCMICNNDYSDEPCDPSDCIFYNAITHAPTADVAPVVRCDDCELHDLCYVENSFKAVGLDLSKTFCCCGCGKHRAYHGSDL